MVLKKFRITHSMLVEHYQYIEAHLEAIYAAVSDEPFWNALEEIEKDSLGTVVRELQELDKLLEKPLSDWQAEFMGMDITCEVEYSGFHEVDVGVPGLMAEEGVENEYHLVFSMERIQ